MELDEIFELNKFEILFLKLRWFNWIKVKLEDWTKF